MNRILYYHQQSNFSRKIRILLAEKNIECELREINLIDKPWTAADVAALCSLGYYSLRLPEDWQVKYIHLRDWFNKLHERDSVQSTVPQKS